MQIGITGQIMGALYGLDAIPERWLSRLELRDEITCLAEDLWLLASGNLNTDDAAVRKCYIQIRFTRRQPPYEGGISNLSGR